MLISKKTDIVLLGAVVILTGFGVLMVYSVLAPKGGEIIYLKKHLLWVLAGFFVMAVSMTMSIQKIKNLSYPLFLLSLIMLVLVLIPGLGVKVKGAQRWIGIGQLRIQPSEFAKITLIMALASFLANTENNGWNIKRFSTALCGIVLVQLLMLGQPDFGGAMVIGTIGLLMLFIAGAPLLYFVPVVGTVIIGAAMLILSEPYRMERILAFINPWKAPRDEGFQLIQSLVALGRGGLTGVGIGNSEQKIQFLPEVRTDFIFAIAGEELGFMGIAIIISLFFVLLLRGYRIMSLSKGPFGRYLAFGLIMTITLQALLNMAVVSGLVPTKGLPLPFISYGGSAMISNFAAVGILMGISKGEPESVYTDKQKMLRSIARRRLRREGLI